MTDKRNADEVRRFVDEVMEYPSMDGEGWLIAVRSPAEVGIDKADVGSPHEVYVECDNLATTIIDLRKKGVEFARTAHETNLGYAALIKLPGGGTLGLCQLKGQKPSESKA